jgi:hypothetical protein
LYFHISYVSALRFMHQRPSCWLEAYLYSFNWRIFSVQAGLGSGKVVVQVLSSQTFTQCSGHWASFVPRTTQNKTS